MWRGAYSMLFWAFKILNAIVLVYIGFIVCRKIVFSVNGIIKVVIPIEPIFGVQNAFRCAILIIFHCVTVDCSDSTDIKYLSLFSGEVLCRQSWWQRGSF